jgi:hypothetical protein
MNTIDDSFRKDLMEMWQRDTAAENGDHPSSPDSFHRR